MLRTSPKDNSKRKFKSASGPRPDLTEGKRKEAEERQTAWKALDYKAQLDALDRRLGKGVGAKKQRAKIAASMEAAKIPKPKKST
jgi:hypothetical protein